MQKPTSQPNQHTPASQRRKNRLDHFANAGLLLSFGAYFALAYYTLVMVGNNNPDEQFATTPVNIAISIHAADKADKPIPENNHD